MSVSQVGSCVGFLQWKKGGVVCLQRDLGDVPLGFCIIADGLRGGGDGGTCWGSGGCWDGCVEEGEEGDEEEREHLG